MDFLLLFISVNTANLRVNCSLNCGVGGTGHSTTKGLGPCLPHRDRTESQSYIRTLGEETIVEQDAHRMKLMKRFRLSLEAGK